MSKFSLALAVFAGITTIPAVAFAMEPYLPKSPKVFAKLDSDSNGRITLAEIQPRAEKRFLRLDGDKNGEVTTAEIDAALNKAVQQRRNRILAALDADRNGTITKGELDWFIETMMKTADADKDGGVTLEEARNSAVAKLKKPATGESAN